MIPILGGMMQRKSSKLLIVVAVLSIMLLSVTGCGKSGSRFANELPTIKITSYEGYDPTSDVYNVQDTLVFQQRIYWNAEDPDGTITGYAYRVLDADGNPISTPGNKYFDNGEVTPDAVATNPNLGLGWVLHYKPGADQSIPLNNPQASKTIWSAQKYALVNFPAEWDEATNSARPVNSKFEVIAIDNRGGITQLPAFRYFTTWSAKPNCFVQTTKGDPNGGRVGTGIRISFSMEDNDPFIEDTPYYYEFKINKRQGAYVPPTGNTAFDDTINPIIRTTPWYSTYGTEKLNQFLLTLNTNPFLEPDFDTSGNQITHTEVLARVYDLAGIVSDTLKYSNIDGSITGKTSVRFAVKTGFHPQTKIYPQKTYGLGDYHFVDYQEEGSPEIFPFTVAGGQYRFATQMFRDTLNVETAVRSNNFKTWIRWGWWGEYARILPDGTAIPVDDPYEKKVDDVLDPTTNTKYYTEITHFDLRFNDQPYNFPPLAQSQVTDPVTGKRWLRVPVNSPLGQTVVLTTLPAGTHTFEVRAVDLQGVADPNPASYTFTLVEYIPPASRQGILVIDDDTHHSSFSPDDLVHLKYEQALAGYSGHKQYITRKTETNPGNTIADYRTRHLAFSDLQKFRFIIHHSDHPQSASSLPKDHDGLALYLHTGGNLLMSGTHLMSTMFNSMVSATQLTFVQRIGLLDPNMLLHLQNAGESLSSSGIQTNTFLQKALGQLGFGNIYVQYQDPDDLTNYPEPGFQSVVNSRRGLSAASFFRFTNGEVIYKLGCKPTTYAVSPPTQAQYTQFNEQPIAVRRQDPNGGKTYLFGFPLSYMEPNSLKAMMDKVLTEVM